MGSGPSLDISTISRLSSASFQGERGSFAPKRARQLASIQIIFQLPFDSRQSQVRMAQRLVRLRQLLTNLNLGAYVLPRTDQHQSEYLTEKDERVRFLSGFSGSNALAMVSQTEALLWTDSRYFIQAQQELGEGWGLKKMLPEEKKWFEYISEKYPKSSRVGFDPTLLTAKAGIERSKQFSEAGLEFVPVLGNLIDKIWESRPKEEHPGIYLHQEWAGRSLSQKVRWVREKIKEKQGKAALFNDLSEIAWLLNLRSSQIPHNPFFKSVLVVTLERGRLYLPKGHISLTDPKVLNHLSTQKIEMLSGQPQFEQGCLVVKDSINFFIYQQIKDKCFIEWEGIGLYRAIRTSKEIEGFKRCHLADGIALSKFWAWRASQETVTEYQAAQKVDSFRRMQPLNKGLSFDTISAGGPNGAIVHYRPMPSSSSIVSRQMVHLLDSGGQYLDGTTDVTRAFHFGSPTQQEIDAYTRVLLGNLDLQRLRWPEGTLSGAEMDVLARRHLWSKGLNYLHGTGHGVGYFAGVHEMPVGISRLSHTKFKKGMVVTNQPGYYAEGQFGIRIENMLVVQEEGGFNYFQNLTLCPYDRNLIDCSLLDGQTVKFIDQYHSRVWQKLAPHLGDDWKTLEWLAMATRPLL